MKHLTGKSSEKGMHSKSFLLSCSDLFLSICSFSFFSPNKTILILHQFFSRFIFRFFSSFWEAKYFLFCPSLPFPLLSAHLCCLICWSLNITGSPTDSFPSLFSLALHFSFRLFFFFPLSLTLACLAVSSCPLFFLIEILVTLDLFGKDHKAVRPLGR